MYCVIPAAGRGVRFNELGKNYPKCVLPYKDVPIIVHNIRLALNSGAREVCIVIGHQGEKIKDISTRMESLEIKVDELLKCMNKVLTAVNTYNTGAGMSTAQAEALGTYQNSDFAQMAFSIEKVTVTANTRALKAEYTMELAQDLKAIHGLDAETELANILSAEILAEINREVVRTINITAEAGAQDNTTTAGVFDLDTDSNGRWSVEKFKGLMFQLEREANAIAKQTRRGKGNIVICSSDVASALQMAGVLDYAPALNSNNLQVDDTGNTFAGVLNGRIKVYIDPYFSSASGKQYFTIGYKGSSAFDAGLFYCPYVPLQMVRAVGQDTFQPKIGFKTRYGMVANPFATTDATGAIGAYSDARANKYYRFVAVSNLM